MKNFRWIDLALVPFGLCVLFLLLLGKLLGLTYKQISVVFNLWGAGSRLGIVGVSSFWYSRLQDDGVVFDRLAGSILHFGALWYGIRICFHNNGAALSFAI